MNIAAPAPDLRALPLKGSLPSLPAVALEVIRLSQEAEPDLQKISEVIGRDPVLAGKLLKLSNSPIFGRAREVTTISGAVMVLGLKAVKMAAVSLSLAPAIGRGGPKDREIYDAFWRRAVSSGVAARQVAQVCRMPFAEEAFLAGLLMDIGFPTLMVSRHAPYEPAVAGHEAGHPQLDVERECLEGATHADVSGFILAGWGLAEILVAPVTHHHDPSLLAGAPSEQLALCRILAFAHEVATIHGSARGRAAAMRTATVMARDWFGMEEDTITGFLAGLSDGIVEMGRILEVDVGSSEELTMILAQAQEDILSMSVGATAELEATKSRVQALETKASTDALTGIRNRASFDEILRRHFECRERGVDKGSLAVIMVDVDKFKKFNDTWGHQAGDEVLKVVAKTLEENIRTQDRHSDAVCRYGGEEFVCVLPDLQYQDLGSVAERLRKAVERTEVRAGDQILHVTASFGASLLKRWRPGVAAEALVKAADLNLYAAKEGGRNRCVVSVYPDP